MHQKSFINFTICLARQDGQSQIYLMNGILSFIKLHILNTFLLQPPVSKYFSLFLLMLHSAVESRIYYIVVLSGIGSPLLRPPN